MAMGDCFKTAWHNATEEARHAAAGLGTAGSSATRAAEWTATETAQVALWAEQKTTAAAQATGTAASAVAHAGLAAGKTGAKMIAKVGSSAWKGITRVAETAYDAVAADFTSLKAGAHTIACMLNAVAHQRLTEAAVSLLNFSLNTGASVLALDLTSPFNPLHDVVLEGLKERTNRTDMAQYDGHVVGAGCSDNAPGSTPRGVLPSANSKCSRLAGKTTYINGIKTDFHPGQFSSGGNSEICYTMQKIADLTCSEVLGIYNATQGIGQDLAECEQNIETTSGSPAVKELADEIADHIRNETPMTIFAHSQGGLVTQEALIEARNQLKTDRWTDVQINSAMRVISIKSFGTATERWPPGPNYEQFTNRADPVPQVIMAAQLNLSPLGEPHAVVPPGHQHYFWSAHVNPINSHSMDNVYLEYFAHTKGAQ